MKFSKEFLLENALENEISDKIIDRSRWSVTYRRIFEFQGKFYETHYSVGATEYQEECPYEGEGDEIECKEVFPTEVTVIVYK
jgi:hypothetical protein